ncbi:hypothetical protein PybrP1_000286 [[Pythium] brassicae (nom. inval.)]|nr:hypothetical protein PybrP1_000286 [[Pythium] brassicae (nom. inval.)]
MAQERRHDSAIAQHWSAETVFLSYFIAVSGSYCTIQLMEQWRTQEASSTKVVFLLLSSVALGGCGIWCMHFTGMNALNMHLEDGTLLEVNFEAGTTVVSLVFPLVGVFFGLKVASTDPFFLEIEQSKRKNILASGLQGMSMEAVVRRHEVGRKLKFIVLFSRLQRIAAGGFLAALGVLGMHYLGMLAQRTNAVTSWNGGIIVLSSVVAFVAASAAFWILFRALTFWPQFESLRVGSALIMGVAVCGTHYVGMGAASYAYSDENYALSSRFVFSGKSAANIASHGSLLACYWMSAFAVVTSMRKQVLEISKLSARSRATNTSEHQTSNRIKTIASPNSRGAAKSVILVLSAITLGGCGIWCIHFSGMMVLQLAGGTVVTVDFELGLTVGEALRLASALIMGVAVCGTHYRRGGRHLQRL